MPLQDSAVLNTMNGRVNLASHGVHMASHEVSV